MAEEGAIVWVRRRWPLIGAALAGVAILTAGEAYASSLTVSATLESVSWTSNGRVVGTSPALMFENQLFVPADQLAKDSDGTVRYSAASGSVAFVSRASKTVSGKEELASPKGVGANLLSGMHVTSYGGVACTTAAYYSNPPCALAIDRWSRISPFEHGFTIYPNGVGFAFKSGYDEASAGCGTVLSYSATYEFAKPQERLTGTLAVDRHSQDTAQPLALVIRAVPGQRVLWASPPMTVSSMPLSFSVPLSPTMTGVTLAMTQVRPDPCPSPNNTTGDNGYGGPARAFVANAALTPG